ncbi:hypothetical protein IFM89_038783 [Coptis chinensis]|uniref:Uncharacterized protein n=1 Tax=Coptis chinensis TaxID=261450 RepID=A0A835J020_9MAGN|nr:hypothetical protein IFM89_038783 [Coptis chinensis]
MGVVGYKTRFGNRDWENTHLAASETAVVVSAVMDGGATCAGKTVVDEMALSINGVNTHYGSPTNPAAPTRTVIRRIFQWICRSCCCLSDFSLGTDSCTAPKMGIDPFIKDWVTWNQVFLLIDIICCCTIIFPIVWSIRSLRETSKTDGKAARNLAKMTLFRQFYIVVIGYLYFTRIVVFALRTISAYKYQWVSNAAKEIASLAFYLVIFYMFRPVERNLYFVLDEEEEEAAQQILQDEEFEL